MSKWILFRRVRIYVQHICTKIQHTEGKERQERYIKEKAGEAVQKRACEGGGRQEGQRECREKERKREKE